MEQKRSPQVGHVGIFWQGRTVSCFHALYTSSVSLGEGNSLVLTETKVSRAKSLAVTGACLLFLPISGLD